MGEIMNRRFLRVRFWIATLLILGTLIAAGGTMILVLHEQTKRSSYIIAFHHLGIATTRLESELNRLSQGPGGDEAGRERVRAAFIDLLTEFSALTTSNFDNQFHVDADLEIVDDDHLSKLGEEFGVNGGLAAARRNLAPMSMPKELEALWEPEASEDGIALEDAIARMLRLTATLVRGEGSISSAERRVCWQIEALAVDEIRPLLAEVSALLDAEIDQPVQLAKFFVLTVIGFGFVAALVNIVAVFRPVERAVMAYQADIIADRDKALAAATAKRNFLSVVSHELRTPMNGVLGFASLLLASDLKPEHRKQVEIIQSSGKTLLTLVNDILDFSKLEAGSLDLVDEAF
jgi:hypothetical protein